MPYISEVTILEVQRACDIVEVISQYNIALKRSGSNYKALCPFHDEKTPSFMVSAEKQIFKCFGCQKGGGIFNFVMAIEKVEFPEAVRILAEKAGITIKTLDGGEKKGPDRNLFYRVNEWAAGYFHQLLKTSAQAEPARAYLKKRTVTPETVDTFLLGYALNTWDGLIDRAKKEGFSEQLLLEAGLVVKNAESKSIYDKFRGRLMFPIADARGKCVGFGGRALDDSEPKYLNTPETFLFKKGSLFYGLDRAKDQIEDNGSVCVVEGYFDMIMPYQHGVTGIVATLGTALTHDHVHLLKRYVSKVVLVYDADEAGKKAAERSLDRLLTEDLDIRVARLPSGLDPCDCVVQQGQDAFMKAIGGAIEIFDFLVESLTQKIDTSSTAGQTKLIGEIVNRISVIPNPIRQDILIQRLAQRFGLAEGMLRNQLTRPEPASRPPSAPRTVTGPLEQLGRDMIEVLIFQGSLVPWVKQHCALERFPTDQSRRVAAKIVEVYDRTERLDTADLLALLSDEGDAAWVADIVTAGPKDDQFEKRMKGYIGTLNAQETQKKIHETRMKLKQASAAGDREKVQESLKELELLKKEMT